MSLPAEYSLKRRRHLALWAALAFAPACALGQTGAVAVDGRRIRLWGAWRTAGQDYLGQIIWPATGPSKDWKISQQLAIPTRAHGLQAGPDGVVYAAARRPGDWLLRWQPASAEPHWHWLEEDRRLNGHLLLSADGKSLYSSETSLEDGQGWLVQRDPQTLKVRAAWPSAGRDTHQVLELPQALGELPAGTLLLANGGISTMPESGRSKLRLETMDSSLVAIAPDRGKLLGQWRLPDPFLSIRHLAWDAHSRCLGLALQAEHADPVQRQQACLLAVWDGRQLRLASSQPALAGYAGDITSLPGGGFALSCAKAGMLACFDAHARWQCNLPLPGACALARVEQTWLAAGATQMRHYATAQQLLAQALRSEDWQWDNHWVSA